MIRLPGRCVRYALLAAGSAAAFLLAAPAAPASAAPVADLNCTITVTSDVHPALTPEVHHVHGTSHGLTGTATCTGTINGQPVTGPGQFKVTTQGVLAAPCGPSTSQSEFVLRIPTTGGTRTVAGRYHATTAAPVSVLTGDITGTAQAISVVGDCFTTPITSTTVVITGHVT